MNRFLSVYKVIITLILFLPTVNVFARQLIAMDDIQVSISSSFKCNDSVYLNVEANDISAFQGYLIKLQKILRSTRAILNFECNKIKHITINGKVNNIPVYIAYASVKSGWQLIDIKPIPHRKDGILYQDNIVSIHSFKSNTNTNGRNTGCIPGDKYIVSAIFNVNKNYVFSSQYLKKTILVDRLIKFKNKYCPLAETEITVLVFVKDVYLTHYRKENNLFVVKEIEKGGEAESPFLSMSVEINYVSDKVYKRLQKKYPHRLKNVYRKGDVLDSKQIRDIRIHNPLISQEVYNRISAKGKIKKNVIPTEIASVGKYLALEKKERIHSQKLLSNLDDIITERSTRKSQIIARLSKQYGIVFKNLLFASYIDNNSTFRNDIYSFVDKNGRTKVVGNQVVDYKEMLMVYFWETTKLCQYKTVGKPYKEELYYGYSNYGETVKVRKSGNYLIYSSYLKPFWERTLKGSQWGNENFNFNARYLWREQESNIISVKDDIHALIDKNGCGSKPFLQFEKAIRYE